MKTHFFLVLCFFGVLIFQNAAAQSDSLLMPMLKLYENEKKIQSQHAQNLANFIQKSEGKALNDSLHEFIFMPFQTANTQNKPSVLPYHYFNKPTIPKKEKSLKTNR